MQDFTVQPSLPQYVASFTIAFVFMQAVSDPYVFRYKMNVFIEMVTTLVNAPLDIISGFITDYVKYEENLRKYKVERKKHLYWDQVPISTQRTWKVVKQEQKEEINLEKTIMQTKQAAASFLMNFQKKLAEQNSSSGYMDDNSENGWCNQRVISLSLDDIKVKSSKQTKSPLNEISESDSFSLQKSNTFSEFSEQQESEEDEMSLHSLKQLSVFIDLPQKKETNKDDRQFEDTFNNKVNFITKMGTEQDLDNPSSHSDKELAETQTGTNKKYRTQYKQKLDQDIQLQTPRIKTLVRPHTPLNKSLSMKDLAF